MSREGRNRNCQGNKKRECTDKNEVCCFKNKAAPYVKSIYIKCLQSHILSAAESPGEMIKMREL